VLERLCSLSVVGITLRGPVRVKTGKAQNEQTMSALPPILTVKADIPDRQLRANRDNMHRSKKQSLFDRLVGAPQEFCCGCCLPEA